MEDVTETTSVENTLTAERLSSEMADLCCSSRNEEEKEETRKFWFSICSEMDKIRKQKPETDVTYRNKFGVEKDSTEIDPGVRLANKFFQAMTSILNENPKSMNLKIGEGKGKDTSLEELRILQDKEPERYFWLTSGSIDFETKERFKTGTSIVFKDGKMEIRQDNEVVLTFENTGRGTNNNGSGKNKSLTSAILPIESASGSEITITHPISYGTIQYGLFLNDYMPLGPLSNYAKNVSEADKKASEELKSFEPNKLEDAR